MSFFDVKYWKQLPLFGDTDIKGHRHYFIWSIEHQEWLFTWETA